MTSAPGEAAVIPPRPRAPLATFVRSVHGKIRIGIDVGTAARGVRRVAWWDGRRWLPFATLQFHEAVAILPRVTTSRMTVGRLLKSAIARLDADNCLSIGSLESPAGIESHMVLDRLSYLDAFRSKL